MASSIDNNPPRIPTQPTETARYPDPSGGGGTAVKLEGAGYTAQQQAQQSQKLASQGKLQINKTPLAAAVSGKEGAAGEGSKPWGVAQQQNADVYIPASQAKQTGPNSFTSGNANFNANHGQVDESHAGALSPTQQAALQKQFQAASTPQEFQKAANNYLQAAGVKADPSKDHTKDTFALGNKAYGYGAYGVQAAAGNYGTPGSYSTEGFSNVNFEANRATIHKT